MQAAGVLAAHVSMKRILSHSSGSVGLGKGMPTMTTHLPPTTSHMSPRSPPGMKSHGNAITNEDQGLNSVKGGCGPAHAIGKVDAL